MDSHLATLDATLASIASLQRNLFTSPKPQPFTNAYLGPIDASLLPTGKAPRDFIRECDAFERNLFHFPAVGAVLDDDGITRRGRELTEDEAASAAATGADTAAELVPRNPQIRTVSVPTPLRDAGQRAHGGTKQQQQDAKVSLVAAQRLNDNYQRAPRARKHIRQLLKRNAELMSQSSSQSAQAAKLEDVLSRIANGESPKTMIDELTTLLGFGAAPDAGGASSAAVSSSAEEEKRRKRRLKEMKDKLASVRDELNREEMEVLALEEMREDMLRKKVEIERRQQKASGPSETTSLATIGKPAGASTARAVPRVVAAANAAKNRSPRKSVEATEVSATKPSSTTATTTTSTTSGAGPGAGVRKLAAGARASMRPSTGGPLSGVSALKKPSVVSSTSTIAGKPVSKSAIAPRASLGPNKAKSQSAGLASSTAPVEKQTAQTMPEAVPEPEDDITIRLSNRVPETRQSDEDTSGDNSLLVRPTPAGTAHSDFGASALASADASAADPEATDELERLSEKIWNSFGDHLRYFLRDPDATDGGGGATEEDVMTDFRGTLQLLRRLMSSTQGDGSASGGAMQRGKDDASSISSAPTSLSGKTTSATGSTPPDVVARVTAFVLLELLTAPAPHMVDFPLLKTNAKAWFTENPSVLAKATAGDDDEGEAASSDEEALVTKAVYAMVAKKLLRIRRTGGQAKVGFSPGD
ncbi:unnamed protein product [Jaminaea pallidilutea]